MRSLVAAFALVCAVIGMFTRMGVWSMNACYVNY